MNRCSPTPRTLGLAIASFGVALAAHAAPCLQVEAPGRVQLPDGREYDARMVQVCPAQPFTPATSLLEVRIDGVSAGRFLAAIRDGVEAPTAGPAFVVFDRLGTDQPYRLTALTVEHDGAGVSHRLWRKPVLRSPEPPAVETVAVAARWD